MPFSARGGRGARQRVFDGRRTASPVLWRFRRTGWPDEMHGGGCKARYSNHVGRAVYSERGGRLPDDRRKNSGTTRSACASSGERRRKSGDPRHAESLLFPAAMSAAVALLPERNVDAHHRKHPILRRSACCRLPVFAGTWKKKQKKYGDRIRPTGSKWKAKQILHVEISGRFPNGIR